MRAASSGVRSPSSGKRDVGATVGNEHDVLHRRASYGAGGPAPRAGAPVACSACVARTSARDRRRRARCSPRAAAARRRRDTLRPPTSPAPDRRPGAPPTSTSDRRPDDHDAPTAPDLARVHVALTPVVVRSRQPGRARVARARPAHVRRRADRAASASSTRTATSRPRRCSRSGRCRTATRKDCSASRSRPTARSSTSTTPIPATTRTSTSTRCSGEVAVASTPPAGARRRRSRIPNHNGGEVIIGPDGMLYIGLGDGGSAGDPNHNGQNLGTLLGEDPAHQSRGRAAASPYSVPADNPFVGRAGVAARDVDVGTAQSVALLVRPRDRRHVDRRRRPEQVRGDRLRARGRQGHQLGLERARRLPRVSRRRAAERRARSAARDARTPTATARSSAATCTAARRSPRSTASTCSATTATSEHRRRRRIGRARSSRSATSAPTVAAAHDVRRGPERRALRGRRATARCTGSPPRSRVSVSGRALQHRRADAARDRVRRDRREVAQHLVRRRRG